MARHSKILLLVGAISGMIGCEKLDALLQANKRPIIDQLAAVRYQVSPNDTTTVKVEAHDPEGDALSFEWSAQRGTLSSSAGRHVVWTAPATAGTYKIGVKARDSKRGETEASVNIAVVSSEAPAVKITQPANDAYVAGLGTIIIEAIASHPNGIREVQFRAGNAILGADNSPPYQQPWRVEGLSGSTSIVATAFRTGAGGTPGVDSIRVNIEGVTRL